MTRAEKARAAEPALGREGQGKKHIGRERLLLKAVSDCVPRKCLDSKVRQERRE